MKGKLKLFDVSAEYKTVPTGNGGKVVWIPRVEVLFINEDLNFNPIFRMETDRQCERAEALALAKTCATKVFGSEAVRDLDTGDGAVNFVYGHKE